MSVTLYVFFLVLALVSGYILHPFTFKYLKALYCFFVDEVEDLKDDTKDKFGEIESIVERQIKIGKDKGEDISEEAKDILEDLEQIWDIIKR